MHLNALTIGQGYFSKGPLEFRFEAQGLYAIEGVNGAGKSTLMKTLSRRLKPLSGSVDHAPNQIAYAGTEGLLFWDWTIEENIHWISSIYQSPLSLQSKNLETLKSVASYKVRELSSGWKQLSEVLLALSLHCPLILLDEPFQALDTAHTAQVWNLIQSVSQKSLVLLADHRGMATASDTKGKLIL